MGIKKSGNDQYGGNLHWKPRFTVDSRRALEGGGEGDDDDDDYDEVGELISKQLRVQCS